MAFADRGAGKQSAQCGGRIDLAAMTTQRVDVGMEGGGRTHGGVGRHSAGDQCCLRGAVGAEETGKRQRRRGLGAVDQRQAFLGGQHDGRQGSGGKRLGAGHAAPFEEGFAMAHHHGCHMGERGEVAGSTNRALLGNDRDYALFEHGFDQTHEFETDAGGAATERNELQRQDQTHDVFGKRLAHAAAMRQDQIALKRRDIGAVDLDRGEFAEAGVDAVDRGIAGDDFGDAAGRLLDSGVKGRVQTSRLSGPVDGFEVAKGHGARM
ncbi:hypothetical protein D9M68_504930 [compost metagenome]